jgi:hypothetical protein
MRMTRIIRMTRIFIVVLVACSDTRLAPITRTDCVTCHPVPLVTDPAPPPCMVTDHSSFPMTCGTCHGTTAWCPADAMHTQFPLTGSHEGWNCADCHLAISYDPPVVVDPTAITCIDCHWHEQARVDPYHIGKSGYSYGPRTCLAPECHGGGQRL